jgi:hypothetical protein
MDPMEGGAVSYESVVDRLAPCGLDCRRCARCVDGDIVRLARGLKARLLGFETMAARVADHNPVLSEYSGFAAVLDFLGCGDCPGCRAGGTVPMPFCAAHDCYREKGVDFCFQCDEYPCERNNYPENLRQRWRSYNDRMREVGAVAYYLESLDKPRY